MRAQIHKSLLLTGILSVVISFLVAGILYYQGIQARALHEIGHLTEIAADGLTGDAVRDIAFRDRPSKSEREMHITWFGSDGTVLYASHPETDGGADEPEIRDAIADGTGHSVRKNPNGEPMSYSAQKAADGSILRIAVPRSAPAGILTPLLPEILLFLGMLRWGALRPPRRRLTMCSAPAPAGGADQRHHGRRAGTAHPRRLQGTPAAGEQGAEQKKRSRITWRIWRRNGIRSVR